MRRSSSPAYPAAAGARRLGVRFLVLVFALLLGLDAAFAASAGNVSGRRTALVIGNSHYRSFPELPNGLNDARRVKEVLTRANFDVVLGEDLDARGLERTIRAFLRSLNDGDVALFYYSGHAAQVAGENYILPTDASLASPYDLEVEAYDIGNLLDYMRRSSALQIAILDACRNNPFPSGYYYVGDRKVDVGGSKGLAAARPGEGSLIVYSTAPNEVAYDGTDALSPFTSAFSDNVLTPNTEVRELLARIRAEVIEKTGGRQTPWDLSSLTTSFYFVTRQNLIIMQDVTEVMLRPDADKAPLGIPPPIASGDAALKVRFTRLPEKGTLWLAGEKLDPAAPLDAARLADLAYSAAPDDASPETLEYAVESADGRKVAGVVRIAFDAAAPAPAPVKPGLTIVAAPAGGEGEKIKPTLIAVAADVGTGFAEVRSDAEPPSVAAADGWLRLAARDPGAQVALGDRLMAEGDLVKAADVARLRIRPALAAAGGEVAVSLVPAVAGTAAATAVRAVAIRVAASVNRCDELAGEPFDIQGVTEGVLPNEIDVPAAKEACRQAAARYPDIPRFAYQYGRALYADGDFDAAIARFRAAYDAGHVRAGEILGRLYQLGVGVERDPAKAIPLFEAGAARGDPYAQFSLGKSLVLGNGVKPDITRGMELMLKAAESGHTFAMNQLGGEYRYGTRTKQDFQRALAFFQKSADRKDVYGEVNLGLLYRDGAGVPKDWARARALFVQADQSGHPYAATLVGMMMRDDDNAAPREVLEWFRRSAARGDAWGAFFAAQLLSADPTLEKGAGEAVRLYAFAASQETFDVSDRAKVELAKLGASIVGSEVQATLKRMGQEVGAIDGVVGAGTRKAAAAALGTTPPRDTRELLVQLIRKEWIASRPRLDML